MSRVAHADVSAALGESGALTLLDRTVVGLEPRDDHTLVLLDSPRWESGRVETSWPDDRLRPCIGWGMDLLRAVPILTVTDVDAAVREYSKLLGLDVLMNLGWVATLGTGGGAQFSVMDIDQSAPCNPRCRLRLRMLTTPTSGRRPAMLRSSIPYRMRNGASAAFSAHERRPRGERAQPARLKHLFCRCPLGRAEVGMFARLGGTAREVGVCPAASVTPGEGAFRRHVNLARPLPHPPPSLDQSGPMSCRARR